MSRLTLKSILSARSGALPAVLAALKAMGDGVGIVDTTGSLLLGEATATAEDGPGAPVLLEDSVLGFVTGPASAAAALAAILTHLISREVESRALGAEVLHLYREIHLIEQLSEQLAALLNLSAVCESALAQAQRLIPATHGGILVMKTADSGLTSAASFGDPQKQGGGEAGPLSSDSLLAASVLERGIAEIVNSLHRDPRALDSERHLGAVVCAPLIVGQRKVGVITLASAEEGAAYTSADLKLLNTIALQAAAAISNQLLCAEMIDAARVSTALAAELHAATTVQQLLLQNASSATPGFEVESVYLPASEVGGDFFFVSSGEDGSLTAIVGDVSGKGLTAAMRVAMILGVLRRETSDDPSEILSGLNEALMVQGQLGFTTGCCIRISLDGEYALANAGHIAPYISGVEIATPAALPLGLVPNQTYELVQGRLGPGDRLVLLSDGVLEARSETGELYGFDRLTSLTLLPSEEIARAAQVFGQEDDIMVVTVTLKPSQLD